MTNTSTEQPEALLLADDLEASSKLPGNYRTCNAKAAAELRRLHARVQELEAAQAARRAPVVPSGWRVVPVEPTLQMKRAGMSERHDDLSRSVYQAMIAAAPYPPEGDHIPDVGKMVE